MGDQKVSDFEGSGGESEAVIPPGKVILQQHAREPGREIFMPRKVRILPCRDIGECDWEPLGLQCLFDCGDVRTVEADGP